MPSSLQIANSSLEIGDVLVVSDPVLLMSFVKGADQAYNLVVNCLTDLSLHGLAKAIQKHFDGSSPRGTTRSGQRRSVRPHWQRIRSGCAARVAGVSWRTIRI